jgi:DNA topoisomerase IA
VAQTPTGLVVLERHYLDVYPYDKWTGHVLPPFEEDQEFRPSTCVLKEGRTACPSLLTEADLVALMDKNGIGKLFKSHSLLTLYVKYRNGCDNRAAYSDDY